uniref:RCC1-like domain-containing protein n=1 Tax=Cairina moschata TaxID=8855 RepID=A0A8C3BR78_CAIMO
MCPARGRRVAFARPPPPALPMAPFCPAVSHPSHRTQPGLVLSLGQGDVGQLGLGEGVMERKKPALVQLPELIVQAEAGGMHTVCLSETGKIYTFGCNDEGALGRDTSAEGSETTPGLVELQEKVVQVSAGDSHTAALTDDGRVFVWGSFRDNNGVIGLLEPMKTSSVPVLLQLSSPVVKIVSGNDHLVMLTMDGDLFTCGCGEQGQLGRVPELFANRGGRKGLREWLWGSGTLVAAGSGLCAWDPTLSFAEEVLYPTVQLGGPKLGSGVCCGTGGLPSAWSHLLHVSPAPGKAYSLGRAEYGRLGLGEGAEEKSTPTVIPDLPSISSVACGASVGYAVSSDGEWQAPPAHGALPSPPLPLLGGCPTASTPPGLHHGLLGQDLGQVPVLAAPAKHPARGSRAAAAQIFLWALGGGVWGRVLTREGVAELLVPSPSCELGCCESSLCSGIALAWLEHVQPTAVGRICLHKQGAC